MDTALWIAFTWVVLFLLFGQAIGDAIASVMNALSEPDPDPDEKPRPPTSV